MQNVKLLVIVLGGVSIILLSAFVFLSVREAEEKTVLTDNKSSTTSLDSDIPVVQTPDVKPVVKEPVVVNSELRVAPASGGAPLTVTISAPSDVMEKVRTCEYAIGFTGTSGNGLTVNWGDGNREPNDSFIYDEPTETDNRGVSCTSVVSTHTYTNPATYTVDVWSWHPGPTDAPIIDWRGTTIITVR